jgi:hypothetical protein
MTARLLASGVAALTIIGAAAAGMTPAARASTDQSGIRVQRVTRGPYAQDTTTIPLGSCLSSLSSVFCSGGDGAEEAPPPGYAAPSSPPPDYAEQQPPSDELPMESSERPAEPAESGEVPEASGERPTESGGDDLEGVVRVPDSFDDTTVPDEPLPGYRRVDPEAPLNPWALWGQAFL